MNKFLNWLDTISLPMLAAIALLFAIVPVQPEPHLWEKLKMLANGALARPIDIFDLLMHGTPLLLLLTRLYRQFLRKSGAHD